MFLEVVIPIKGVFKGMSVEQTPTSYSGHMNNVRPRDVLENRIRIGQRPGLVKWGAGTLCGDAEQPIVAMCVVDSIV